MSLTTFAEEKAGEISALGLFPGPQLLGLQKENSKCLKDSFFPFFLSFTVLEGSEIFFPLYTINLNHF